MIAPADYPNRAAASSAAAARIARVLRSSLANEPRVTLVVSGGSSPAATLTQLSTEALDWARVDVLLSDERQVPADHPDSNTGMLQRTLLQNAAADASLISLRLDADLQERTPAVALLGMGTDGHFASIFPDAVNLSGALDPNNSRHCVAVHTAASPHPRISLTWSFLHRSQHLLLLAFGEEKKALLLEPNQTPIATVLAASQTELYWAP